VILTSDEQAGTVATIFFDIAVCHLVTWSLHSGQGVPGDRGRAGPEDGPAPPLICSIFRLQFNVSLPNLYHCFRNDTE